ncbi:MAG TPA: hypothetical protein VES42_04100 [Pilimelia sp.]|nr:hypothetical protein [Pilimelia sp.]
MADWRVVCAGVVSGLLYLTLPAAAPPHAQPADRADAPAARIAGVLDLPRPPDGPSWAPRPVTTAGLRAVATAGPAGCALRTAGGAGGFLPGVNLGSTTPGSQPGELAVDADDYRAWFAAMGRLGVRAVRVYTIHPPAFYTELAAHNRAYPDRPLYLVHGVYLPDETAYLRSRNLYDATARAAFTRELRDASAAVSGTLTRPRTRGRASGTWTTDVSAWLAAWVIGVEWDPPAVAASDAANADAPAFAGRYFRSTPAASPTERWLAARMDELATAEAARGRTAPVAFVNWPSTDPLRHPDEPLREEDLVGIDANHVRPTAAWPGGTFASYHAYPYYPDFQRHAPALLAYRHRGRPDPYAGYLAALRRHHKGLPVIITEFGVPSSVGSAHPGPLGRDPGDHSEQEAMAIDADLLRIIHDVGLAGGFVFSWVDEWFKFTWNTINHHVPPGRRQLWHDVLTNEQHFGVLAADATGDPEARPTTLLDAASDAASARPARRVMASVDESYLHLSIKLADPRPARLTVGLDVLPSLTGAPPPGSTDRRADAALVLDLAARTGQAWLRGELDPVPLDYGRSAIRSSVGVPRRTGDWRPFHLIVNRALVVPSTGRRLPAEMFNAGALRHGPWDPADPAADSRALWRVTGTDLTVRVPWAMAGFGDPSSHSVLVPRDGVATADRSPGVAVTLSARGTDQRAGTVRWAGWQRVHHRERLKRGAGALRDALVATGG